MRAIFYLKTPTALVELGYLPLPDDMEAPPYLWTATLPPEPDYPILVAHTQPGVPGTVPFQRAYTMEITAEVAYIREEPFSFSPA